MEGKVFDEFSTNYNSRRAAYLAAKIDKLFDNCGPEGYCAYDVVETQVSAK